MLFRSCPMATLAPLDCPSGAYCPYGSAAPTLCPGGSYSNATNLATLSECNATEPGFYAYIGSVEPTPCAAGTYNDQPRQESCIRCESGKYQDAEGETECKPCEPGHWCSAAKQYECSLDTFNPLPQAAYVTNCTRCPPHTTTLDKTGATSVDQCVCQASFYMVNTSHALGGAIHCKPCTSGSACTHAGVTLETLPLDKGYFRVGPGSSDIRKCPGVNNGCIGGADTQAQCSDGLTGLFCSRCTNSTGRFYVPGSSLSQATCKDCPAAGVGVALVTSLIAVAGMMVFAGSRVLRRSPQIQNAAQQIVASLHRLGVPSKLKQLVGFYQLSTSVDTVYQVALPDAAKAVFDVFRITISLGLGDLGIPLQCTGLGGYRARLIFWMVMPLVVLFAIPLALASVRLVSVRLATANAAPHFRWRHQSQQLQAKFSPPQRAGLDLKELAYDCLPICLKFLFLAYPFVSTVAFRAFDCMDFGQSGSWLRADYQVPCDTGGEYRQIQAIAVLALCIFPCGVPVAYAALLFHSRSAILTDRPTQLSQALSFLHEDFRREFFWWELVEVLRRFLLVGVACVISPGTLNQIFLGTAVALFHLVVQMQARPFKRPSEGFLSMASGFLLIVIFTCCILLQINTLDEQTEITEDGQISLTDRLTPELRERFSSSTLFITTGLILSVLGALLVALGILISQRSDERKRAQQEALLRRLRRLRYLESNELVALPSIGPERYHLFLSHSWKGGGQDAMRVIKQRLKEMIPEVSIFLDVDDLEVIGDLDRYIASSSAVLVFVTAPYVQSKNCIIELRSSVQRATPLIQLVDYNAEQGGLSAADVERELIAADSRYSGWGFDDAEPPRGKELCEALRDNPPIEWSRLSAFQDVAMRLIAEQLLAAMPAPPKSPKSPWPKSPKSPWRNGFRETSVTGRVSDSSIFPGERSRSARAKRTFLDGAAEMENPLLPAPRGGNAYHLYCSPLVEGGLALTEELRAAYGADQQQQLRVTQDAAEMEMCDHVLVYLTRTTWQSGTASADFAEELARALTRGFSLLLVHEMPGLDQHEELSCEFSHFFESNKGSTPLQLLRAGIYKQVAVPLKGGALRHVSMVLLARALSEEPSIPQVGYEARDQESVRAHPPGRLPLQATRKSGQVSQVASSLDRNAAPQRSTPQPTLRRLAAAFGRRPRPLLSQLDTEEQTSHCSLPFKTGRGSVQEASVAMEAPNRNSLEVANV